MKRIKHAKVKNTGIVFELLVRQVASDTMNNENSQALRILKKHFKSDSVLAQELKLYRTLSNEKFLSESKAMKFLEAVVRTRKQLNESQLRRDKYNLIKDLKNTYNLDEFFKSRIINYKTHASTYKLFEYAEADEPAQYTTNKFSLVEHIQTQPKVKKDTSALSTQHKDVRILASKMVVDKFNEKYSGLNESQKNLLNQYITHVNDTEQLKQYFSKVIPSIKKELKEQVSLVTDKATKIKINGLSKMLCNVETIKVVKESHVLSLLRYYDLITELKKVNK